MSARPHILVLDSSPEFLKLMTMLLAEERYRVSTRDHVPTSVADVVALAPDLVIIDFLWSHEDTGWKTLQLLKLDRQTGHLPCILCTTGVREVEVLQPQLTDMQVEVVIKPFDLDVMLDAVSRQLMTRS